MSSNPSTAKKRQTNNENLGVAAQSCCPHTWESEGHVFDVSLGHIVTTVLKKATKQHKKSNEKQRK
jgi:hypothetical protein